MENKDINQKRGLGASKTVAIMMLATILAKGLGLVRQMMMASCYGVTVDANVFSVASQIPLQFFDMLFATAISGCFIPAYNSFARKKDGGISEEADDFASSFFNLILISTGVLALIGILLSGPISMLLGFDSAEEKQKAANLMRIMFPMIIFTGTAYTLTGLMQSRGKYLVPAVISALSNAVVIIYFFFFDDKFGIYGLAVAYLIGWFLQLMTLVIPLIMNGFRFKPVLRIRSPQMIRAIKLAPSIMIGSWLIPATHMSAMYFTSFVGSNGSVLYEYANTAFTMISGILVYSICNYALPQLSRLAAAGDEKEFNGAVRTGVLSVFALVLPFMIIIMFLSSEIISVLYQRGEFSAESVALVSSAFRLISVAMPAFAVIELGSRVFYSKNLGNIPMKAAICGVAVDVVISAALVFSGVSESLGVNTIIVSTVIGFFVAGIIIVIGAFRRIRGVFVKYFALQIMKILACTACCGAAAAAAHFIAGRFIENYIPAKQIFMSNIVSAIVTFVPAILVYLAALKLFHVDFKCRKDD